MKTILLSLAVALFVSATAPAQAQTAVTQDLISPGRVIDIAADGSLILRQDGTGTPLLFRSMNVAPLFFADGRTASFSDIQLQQHATVYYRLDGKRWVVGKLVIANPKPATTVVPTLTAAERNALLSPAANDGDITTQPGTKARIDGDITTKPGSKDPREHDITRKPAR